MNDSALRGDSRSVPDRLWERGFRASPARRHAFALGAGLLAALARIALNPVWGQELPYILYYPVTLLSALYGGFWTAMAGAAVMSVVTWFFILTPPPAFVPLDMQGLSGLLVFILIETMIAWISARHRSLLSERHAAAVADGERATLLQTVLDTSPAPVWIALDTRCERIIGNAAGDALLGAPEHANVSLSAAEDERPGYRCFRDGVEVPPDQLPVQRAARDGVFVRAEEYEIVRPDGSRAWLLIHATPLMHGGRVTGAVAAGMEISDRKRAEQRVTEDLHAMTLLQRLGTVLASSSSNRSVHLEAALDVAIQIARADKGAIQVWDEGTGVPRIAAQRGFSRSSLDHVGRLDADSPATRGHATRSGQPVAVADVMESDLFTGTPSLRVLLDEGIRAVQSTPLVSTDGRIVGMIAVHFARPHQPDDRVSSRLNILARQLADYLERTSMLVGLRQSADRDAYRVHLSDALRSLADDTTLQATAARLLSDHLTVSRCCFGEVEADDVHITVAAEHCDDGVPSIAGRYRMEAFGSGLVAELRAGRMIAVADTHGCDDVSADGQAAFDTIATRALAAIPLVRGGRLAAVFAAMQTTSRQWEPQELLLIRETGERVWSAVEAARVVTRLRDSEERFRTISDALPSLVFDCMPDGRNTFVNRAFCEFAGRSADGLLGDRWLGLVHPDDVALARESWDQARTATSAFVSECRLRRHDGAWRWHLVRSVPQRDAAGVVQRWIGTATDITDLRQTQEALQEADRRKDEFLAILAHELRNPLAPIRTSLELLRLGRVTPGSFERLRPILERQVAHMVRLIDDLLEVSRITSGKVHLEREPAPLADLVRTAVDANRAAIEAAGLDLSVSLPDTPCLLDVDATRFVQVVSNLLHNASKFTNRGGRVVVAAHLEQSGSSPELRLTVSDTGIGIEAEALPRVFDLFVQADEGRVGQTGLGIGLGLAKQLVEAHGGRIEASSAGHGQGSAFTIHMPVLMSAARAPRQERPAPAGTIARRVLIVDDNVDAADTLAAFVEAHGGSAMTAHSGEDGVRAAARFMPELILLDIGMPGLDGYETCRRLRTVVNPDTSIVAVTGWGQKQDRARAFASGFDAHLTKPADPHALERLLLDPPRMQTGSRM